MENNAQSQNAFPQNGGQSLPNATAVLVLGIISIVTCWCYGIVPIVCGIIALVLAKKDMNLYHSMPGNYSESSFKNLKAGRICAIVGVSLGAVYLVIIIAYIAIVGTAILSHPNIFSQMH